MLAIVGLSENLLKLYALGSWQPTSGSIVWKGLQQLKSVGSGIPVRAPPLTTISYESQPIIAPPVSVKDAPYGRAPNEAHVNGLSGCSPDKPVKFIVSLPATPFKSSPPVCSYVGQPITLQHETLSFNSGVR